MRFPDPMGRQERIGELENEVLYLRRMIEGAIDPEIRNLAASLIALLVARIAVLKRES